MVSMIYSFCCGMPFLSEYPHTMFILADAAIFGILFFTISLFIWNIVCYGLPPKDFPLYRAIDLILPALLITGICIGIETLLVHSYIPEIFHLFIKTLYVRAAICLLLYTIIVLYYLDRTESEKADDIREENELSPDRTLKKSEPVNKVSVRAGNGIKVIEVNDILYIKAEGDYISIITADGSYLKEQTMKSIEESLPIRSFIRIHRSYIIGVSALKRIERYGQQHLIELKNGEKIKISQTGYKRLKESLNL